MKNEELIGRKFLGFKFEDTNTCYYNDRSMDNYIGIYLSIIEFDKVGDVKACNGKYYPLEQVKKHLIPENEVIKVLNEEHGKKVIQYWKSIGVDTKNHKGFLTGMYYGVVNGEFNNYPLGYITNSKAKIITLPEDKTEIKWVWVRDMDCEKWMKRIFLADLGGQITNRYIVVGSGVECRYKRGEKNLYYVGFAQISYTDPNEEIEKIEKIEKEIKELENQINVLKQKLCK